MQQEATPNQTTILLALLASDLEIQLAATILPNSCTNHLLQLA